MAGICGRTVEFLISIVLIGHLVTGRLNMGLFLGAVVVTLIFMFAGTWLTPDE